MEILDIRLLGLAVVAALGYGIATIGMKIASGHWSLIAYGLILLGFIAATQAEVVLMRGVTLGTLYLLIIAIETLIVLTYAYSIGEGLSSRDVGGGALILLGLAIVSH
ncbi:5-aminolevulinate synthase [Roseovarius sp.]|uniref:5-aminolevulinate synthase n=1 Tax=Roseovarius sp. TaxID=1486281 RepID=UPI003D0A8054